jgi:hypothetical protein
MPDARDHQTRKATEELGYERLREQGLTPEAAREYARRASEEVHRNVDRTHSDTTRPPTRRP